MKRSSPALQIIVGVAIVTTLLVWQSASASRCGNDSRNSPLQCGRDDQTDPPNPALGGVGGCTEAALEATPLFKRRHMCAPKETAVIYDLAVPFPNNGKAGDQAVAGNISFATMRADSRSPCAHMVDTVDPLPCPDPQLCPQGAPQPEGTIKAAIKGWIVGCWSPPDPLGCRRIKLMTRAMCLHIEDERLGSGCTDPTCVDVSTEQISIDVPGASNRRLCPPTVPADSCRGTRQPGDGGLRFWIGGFCATSNCKNPGVAPEVDPGGTCEVAWGATKFGYGFPAGKLFNVPGWYDWKSGAFKVDVSSNKPTCGQLGRCLGDRSDQPWDLSLVAVPRPGQVVPCIGDGSSCEAPGCFQ